MPPSRRASGTTHRSDLPRRSPGPPTRVGWPIVIVGLAIGVLAVAWILAGATSPQVAGGLTASRSPTPTTAIAVAPTVSGVPRPTPAPSPLRVRASPRAAPSIVPRTLAPTTAPSGQPARLRIFFPIEGEVLADGQINVVGTAPGGATVTRDVPRWFDDHVTVQSDGSWLMPVSLGRGENVLRFRIGDDRSTERVLSVTYEPGPAP